MRLLTTALLLALGCRGSANQWCSTACSDEFVNNCYLYCSEAGCNDYITCRSQLDRGTGALGSLCSAGCTDTAAMAALLVASPPPLGPAQFAISAASPSAPEVLVNHVSIWNNLFSFDRLFPGGTDPVLLIIAAIAVVPIVFLLLPYLWSVCCGDGEEGDKSYLPRRSGIKLGGSLFRRGVDRTSWQTHPSMPPPSPSTVGLAHGTSSFELGEEPSASPPLPYRATPSKFASLRRMVSRGRCSAPDAEATTDRPESHRTRTHGANPDPKSPKSPLARLSQGARRISLTARQASGKFTHWQLSKAVAHDPYDRNRMMTENI